jgi:hypothetical protein
VRRQRADRLIKHSAAHHHSASQNTGWVMADINLDRMNIKKFS